MLGSARIRPLPARCLAVLVWLCACGKDARAQQPPVDVKVVFVQAAAAKKQASTGSADVSNVAVWLTSLDPSAERAASTTAAKFVPKLVQRNKVFEPHMLVIHVGTVVQFPNKDPFFHNVFSLFDGKRFDLGLYEAGTSHTVTFDSPGICYIFCNIHPEMSAAVVVVDSPWYATSNQPGQFSIPHVPPGSYLLYVWHERGKPEKPGDFPREVSIAPGSASLPTIHLVDAGDLFANHKNKYGRDYDHDKSPSPVYK